MEEKRPQLSLVIPMYNEQKIIRNTVSTLLEEFRALPYSFEIIFSDDGSTDGCANTVSTLCTDNPELKLLCHPYNRGKGAVVRDGVLFASGEYVVFTDCDIAYGVKAVIEVFEILRKGDSDIVIGSRVKHGNGYGGYTKIRRFASKYYLKLVRKIAGFSYSDSQCGIKGFTSACAKRLFPLCVTDGFAFDLEVLMLADKAGFKVEEMGVEILSHNQYSSKVKMIPDAIKMLKDVKNIKKRADTDALESEKFR